VLATPDELIRRRYFADFSRFSASCCRRFRFHGFHCHEAFAPLFSFSLSLLFSAGCRHAAERCRFRCRYTFRQLRRHFSDAAGCQVVSCCFADAIGWSAATLMLAAEMSFH